ncbi:MAG: hypothetical protein M0R80_17715 [Proteobacteria bacterium]|jgi:hypothetical protein|nr:hypothetical protein [Pseudomonadota bacterium]
MTSARDDKRSGTRRRNRSLAERSVGSSDTSPASPLDIPAVPTRLKKGELVAIIREGRERR